LIPAEKFDIPAYLSSLYALFHECLAHAFHAITPKLSKRAGVLPEDRFVEGWMDWVAMKVLEEVLDGTGLVNLPSSLRFLPQRRDHAQDLHRARTKTTGTEISELACQLSTGRSAAMKVFEILKNRGAECPDPWSSFLQLSFDLNMMSDFTEDQRESFVTTLDFLEENDHQVQPNPRHYMLAGIITKYLRNKDIRQFIDSVIELKSKWVAR